MITAEDYIREQEVHQIYINGIVYEMVKLQQAVKASEKYSNVLNEANREQSDLLDMCIRYMADLNGCEWIKGDGVGELDMKQRARRLHSSLSQHKYPKPVKSNYHDK